jgi:hypothetical protein
MNAPLRTLASPYAKRLARERGVTLSLVTGTGPNGRIVADDLLRIAATIAGPEAAPAAVAALRWRAQHQRPPSRRPARSRPSPRRSTWRRWRRSSPASGTGLSIDAFLIKAAARSAGAHAASIRWMKAEGGAVTLARAVALAPTEIDRLIGLDAESFRFHADKAMVVSRLAAKGVRPVAGGLPAGVDLRILVVASDDAMTAEALVVHDAEAISEGEASNILTGFRDLIEAPLRLLV